jgi:hypothetical protein
VRSVRNPPFGTKTEPIGTPTESSLYQTISIFNQPRTGTVTRVPRFRACADPSPPSASRFCPRHHPVSATGVRRALTGYRALGAIQDTTRAVQLQVWYKSTLSVFSPMVFDDTSQSLLLAAVHVRGHTYQGSRAAGAALLVTLSTGSIDMSAVASLFPLCSPCWRRRSAWREELHLVDSLEVRLRCAKGDERLRGLRRALR